MNKQRLVEILTLILDIVKKGDGDSHQVMYSNGLCYVIRILYIKKLINPTEYQEIIKFLHANRPKLGDPLADDSRTDPDTRAWFWGLYLCAPRIAWLEHYITLNTK